MNGRAKPSLAVFVFATIVLIWGTTWLAIRLGLEHYPPFFSLALRFSFAGPMLLLIMALRHEPIPWAWRHQPFFLLIGFLSFILSFGAVYWSEQYLTSGMAAVIFGIMPLLTGVIAHLLIPAERLGRWKLVGLVVGLLGIIVIHSADLAQIDPKAPLAATVILLSPLATALATVMSKRRVHDFSGLALAGIPMTYGAIMEWGLWFVFERKVPLVWSWPGVASIAYLAVFGSLLTFTGYFWLLKRTEVSRLNLIAYFTPLVALSVGVIVAGEPLPARVILGALLILCGIAIANRKTPRKALVGLIVLLIGNSPQKVHGTETVTVNYAVETGSADYHVGAGLGGPWSDSLPDSLISLIKPSAVRIGNLWQNSQNLWERAAHNHTTVVVVVKDAIDARPEAPFLDKDFTDHWNAAGDSLGKMTAWKGHLRHWVDFVMAHRIIGEDTVRVQYDIWNEPDVTRGEGWHPNEAYNSIELFFDVWNTAVDSIRAWDPEAIITGPSFAYAGNGPGSEVSDKSGLTMELFLRRCYEARTLPDVLGSHHIGYSDYTAPNSMRGPCRWNLYAQVADLRDRVNSVFGNIPGSGVDASSFTYEINEMMNPDLPDTDYCGKPHLGPRVHVAVTPGVLVRNVALAERARADGLGLRFACRTVWCDPCSTCIGGAMFYLAHLIDPCAADFDNLFRPRYAWWVYKGYADITGEFVQTSASGLVDAVAGVSASSDTSRILVGNYSQSSSSDLRIILNNLDAMGLVVNDAIQVTVKRLPGDPDSVYLAYPGLAPLLVSSSRLPVSGNSAKLEVPSNQFGQGDALQIEVTVSGTDDRVPSSSPTGSD